MANKSGRFGREGTDIDIDHGGRKAGSGDMREGIEGDLHHVEARLLDRDNREDKYERYLVNDLFNFRYVVCVIWLLMDHPTDELGLLGVGGV